ncbi:unnamed protein product [Leuciscus chuanchicus]
MFLNVYQYPYAFFLTAPLLELQIGSVLETRRRDTHMFPMDRKSGYGRRARTVMASVCYSIAASMMDSLIHIWGHYEWDLYYSTLSSKEQALFRCLRQWDGTLRKTTKDSTMCKVSSGSPHFCTRSIHYFPPGRKSGFPSPTSSDPYGMAKSSNVLGYSEVKQKYSRTDRMDDVTQ